MTRARFTQGDVTRALKGAKAAGLDPQCLRVVIHRTGEICIEPVDGSRHALSREGRGWDWQDGKSDAPLRP